MSRLTALVSLVLLGGGCFTSELDPDRSGVFACDDDTACPDAMRCVGGRCIDEDAVPRLEILAPAPDAAIPIAFAQNMDVFEIRATANFDVIADGETGEYVPGSGTVRLRVNTIDVPLTRIETDGTLVFEIVGIEPTPGPVRMTMTATDSTGERFDNPEATVRRLVFIDDGEPHVALVSPWPDEVFPPEAVEDVRVEVAAINFNLVPPGGTPVEGTGHAHFFQAEPPLACDPLLNPTGVNLPDAAVQGALEQCLTAGGYEVLNQPVEGLNRVFSIATLPAGAPGMQDIFAVLQRNDHLISLFDRDGELFAEADRITIVRAPAP